MSIPSGTPPSGSGQTNTSSSDSSLVSGSWWETYVIRYFVGTVIGGAILLFLNGNKGSSLSDSFLPGITTLSALDTGLLIVIAAAGLAYCYLASAPILVLHASRACLLPSRKSILKWTLAPYVTVILVVMTITLWINWNDEKSMTFILSLSALLLVLGLQLIPLTIAMWDRGNISHKFYLNLTKARAIQLPENQEYKQSYRHLREHGNAFAILFFEGVLGIILFGSSNTSLALIYLLVWVIPATAVWLFGTLLEARFANLT
jgi:hypothetical protein